MPSLYQFLETITEHRTMYAFVTICIAFVPTVMMVFVVNAFHMYFEFSGIQFMHRIATTIGITGIITMILFAGMDIGLMPVLADAVQRRQITYEQAFGTIALNGILFDLGTLILYGSYPLVLLMVSWQKKLLPYWFIVPAVIFALINDINLFIGYRYDIFSNLSGIVTALWPFLMGLVLLRKSQELSVERHHTTPTR